MLKIPIRLLLLSGFFLGQAARLDSRHGEQADVGSEAMQQEEAVQEMPRYRALDQSEFQRWLAGENVSLLATGFQEDETDVELPKEWSSKLNPIKKLGEGSFGKVYQCKVLCEKYQEVYVSVKLIVQKSSMVRKEIQVLENMRGVSDYCISAVGEPPFIDNRVGYWIMMPYMNGGELLDFLHKCNKDSSGCSSVTLKEGRRDWTKLNDAWTTPYILGLFDNMVQGVQALHDKAKLLHIDLKPANVMLNCHGSECYAAVIDLGLACDPKKPGDCGASGTPLYMPREVLLHDVKGLKSPARDVWALGLILYELLYRRAPAFYYSKRDELKTKIIAYDAERDGQIPRTQNVDNLVRSMLQQDFKKRPSLSQIRKEVHDLIFRYVPLDTKAVSMIRYSPAERHASAPIPTCLDHKEPIKLELTPRPLAGGHKYVPGHEWSTTTTTTTVSRRQNLRHERAAEQLEKAQREREEALAAAEEAKRQRDEAVKATKEAQRHREALVALTHKDKLVHEKWLAAVKDAERKRDEAVAATKEAEGKRDEAVAATKEAQRHHEALVALTHKAEGKRDEAVAATKEAQRQHEELVALTHKDKRIHEQWLAVVKDAERKRDEAVAATKEAERKRDEAVAATKEELEKQKHGKKHHDDVEEERVHRRRRRPDAEPTDAVDEEHRHRRPAPPAPTTTTTTTRRSHHDDVEEERVHRRRRRPDAEPTDADEHAHRRRRRPEDS